MPKLKQYTGVTITIDLTDPPYYVQLPTADRDVANKFFRWADGLRQLIRRRMDELESGDISVNLTVSETCDSCNSEWTEDSSTFNGGCCAADLANAPEEPEPT